MEYDFCNTTQLKLNWTKALEKITKLRKGDQKNVMKMGRRMIRLQLPKRDGFTIIEILVVMVVLGILAATGGILMSRMYQRKAIRTEALVTCKNLLDGELNYYIEHGYYYPENNTILLTHGGTGDRDEVQEALKLKVPIGHGFDVSIAATDFEAVVIVTSIKNAFTVTGRIDEDGKVTIF